MRNRLRVAVIAANLPRALTGFRRACLLASEVIEPEHLSILPIEPSAVSTGNYKGGTADSMVGESSLKELADMAVLDTEAQAIRLALHATGGNKSEAARLLKVDYKTLHLKMKRFGIQAGAFRAS